MYTQTRTHLHIQQDSIVPSLIIGGAPKCGTSSLYNWLNDHPEMLGSQPKETFFLMDQDNPLMNEKVNFHKDGLKGYEKFYAPRNQRFTVPFEATTHYIYQETALKVLSEQDPKPTLIFLLRKPSQRILSSFEFTKNSLAGFKKDITFAEYTSILLSGDTGELDEYISRKKSLYVLKRDLYYSTYILFLEKWKKAMGAENIQVLLFEDMVVSPRDTLCNIAHRLSIDDSFYKQYQFVKKNETYGVKNKRVHKIVKQISSSLPTGAIKKTLKNMYLSLQAKRVDKYTDDQEAIRQLDHYFVPYNKELAKSFNLNLALWQ